MDSIASITARPPVWTQIHSKALVKSGTYEGQRRASEGGALFREGEEGIGDGGALFREGEEGIGDGGACGDATWGDAAWGDAAWGGAPAGAAPVISAGG